MYGLLQHKDFKTNLQQADYLFTQLAPEAVEHLEKFTEAARTPSKTFAHNCVAAAAIANLRSNPGHASRHFWRTNASRQAGKLSDDGEILNPEIIVYLSNFDTRFLDADGVPMLPADLGHEDTPATADVDKADKKNTGFRFPLAGLLDGSVAAAAIWSLYQLRKSTIPTATRLVQGGIAGSIGSSLVLRSTETPGVSSPNPWAAAHFTKVAFSLIAAIGEAQLFISQFPALKRMKAEAPGQLKKTLAELKKQEKPADYLRFVRTVFRSLPGQAKIPLLALGSAGTVILSMHGMSESIIELDGLYQAITSQMHRAAIEPVDFSTAEDLARRTSPFE